MNKPLLAAALLAASAIASAQEAALSPIVVTASRTAQTVDESLAPVSVITREDIDRLQPQSMIDLLRLQPGIDVASTGGPGAPTSVFMRGTNSDHTLVLIDGVRANSSSTGGFAWQHLDPAQIERIEIVRGPRAALYGSDAIGGVVQIFTRKPAGATAGIEYGSNNTRDLQLGYGGGARIRYHFLGSFSDSDGYPSRTVSEQDHGYENKSLSAGINAQLWQDARFSLDGWLSKSDLEYDNDIYDPNTFLPIGVSEHTLKTENRVLNARLEDRVTNHWDYSFQLGNAVDKTKADSGEITTRRLSADWQNNFALTSAQTLILGLNYYHDKVDSDDWDVYNETANNRAAFISHLSRFYNFDLELSARRDHHSEFGGRTTGNAALGAQLASHVRAVISHGTAFKAPTFNDLYSPGYGNPDLDPEHSRSTEFSLRYTPGQHRFAANFFYTEVDKLIVYESVAPWSKANIDEALLRGVELEYGVDAGPWRLQANATIQRAYDRSDDSRLLRRPEKKFNLFTGYRFDNGTHLNLETILVGAREDVGAARLGGYGLANLSARFPLAPGFSVEGRIENVFDKDYAFAEGYNTPERAYYVGLRYQPSTR
jgi:vitamin B12 transporter